MTRHEIIEIDKALTASALDLYLESGIPHGMTDFFSGVTFHPKLLSLSTNVGSAAGAIIQATVKGVGVGDSVDLINAATGDSICERITVIHFGIVECLTLPSEIEEVISIDVLDLANTVIYGCASQDLTECQYKTFDSADAIEYTSATKLSETQLKLAGTNLGSFGSFCSVSYAGIQADACTLTDEQGSIVATATYTTGVPVSDEGSIPQLNLKLTDETHTTE